MKNYYTSNFGFAIDNRRTSYLEFNDGLKKGIPIALGYIPVSFTFGLMAVNGGIPVWLTIFISMSNLTSAGQFVGADLIIANASLFEIALTTFVINIRYMLMSLSLSQKITKNMPGYLRCIMAFGITDETFTVASLEEREITFAFMMGLIFAPYFGWALGTSLGSIFSSILPPSLQSCMGIALYAMFIALVVPVSKKSKAALFVTLTGVMISCIFTWTPVLTHISGGWRIIIATILASTFGAVFFPRDGD